MIAADVFNENFNTCVEINFSELEHNQKTYSGLMVYKGRIMLRPRTKVDIRVFVQWTRDKISQYQYPRLTLFPLAERYEPIKRFNTHTQWLGDAVNMKKNYIQQNFTEIMERMDCKAKFINFLKS